MIYLIGGSARCGKSTLARRVRAEIDGQMVSGDAFIRALRDNTKPEWLPDLFEKVVDPFNAIAGQEAKIDRLRRRDQAMWRFYSAYLDTASFDAPKDDLLIEGNIWPDFLSSFSLDHRAVFLGDTSPLQAERLIAIRDSDNDNNWMNGFTDEKLVEWSKFNADRSRRYAELCKQHHYPFFDIAVDGIEGAEQHAFEYLMTNAV